MCPTFGVTEYKAQGQTLVKAILDLKNEPTTKTPIAHKKILFRLRPIISITFTHRIASISTSHTIRRYIWSLGSWFIF
jgi:hypothetical protein